MRPLGYVLDRITISVKEARTDQVVRTIGAYMHPLRSSPVRRVPILRRSLLIAAVRAVREACIYACQLLSFQLMKRIKIDFDDELR